MKTAFTVSVTKEAFDQFIADQKLELFHEDSFCRDWWDPRTGVQVARINKPLSDDPSSTPTYLIREGWEEKGE